MIDESETTEGEETEVTPRRKPAAWWRKQLAAAKDESDRFRKQATDAYADYTYEAAAKDNYKSNRAQNQHFSLFWSNINTQKPLTYSKVPEVVVKTRNYQEDNLGRVQTLIVERVAKHILEGNRFNNTMKRVTQDYLVTGRGLPRVYWEVKERPPEKIYLNDGVDVPEGVELQQDDVGTYYLMPLAPESESVKPCFVSFDSMRHTPGARDWEDVWWVSFDNYYDKFEFAEKFGGFFDAKKIKWSEVIPFNYSSRMEDSEAINPDETKGEFTKIVEIWDYRNRETLFICEDGSSGTITAERDLLGLSNFFPCPEPAQGTLGHQSYYPIPDFVQYRGALDSLDFLENRKWRLIKALRARGIYDANQDELHKLAKETSDADIVPVDNIMELIDKGGLAGVIQFVDTSSISAALIQTYDAIEREKQKVYEISGMSDVVRGASDPSETATAQQIKGNFAGRRLSDKQTEIARVGRDLIEIMVDLALAKFHDQTIGEICGVQFLSEEDQQLYPQALTQLRTDKLRTLKIEIETDSTIALDEAAENEAADALLTTMNTLFQTTIEVANVAPELLPAMRDSAMHRIRRLRKSGPLEAVIQSSFDALLQRVINPKPPPPDPAVELEGQKLQLENQKMQTAVQGDVAKLNMQSQLEAQKLKLEESKLAIQKAEIDAKLQIEREKIAAQLQVQEMKNQLEELKIKIDVLSQSRDLQRKELEQAVADKDLSYREKQPIEIKLQLPKEPTKIGQWVDTPEGRKVVITAIPSEEYSEQLIKVAPLGGD